ncbi:hypothetical protein LSS_22910 [Leptospira santarosai serovar Shermani str. LT 821]|uniref:Uncharacterized protein n=1 Tax=Leptospira santarosai serovar Shermani str. LT 821 TaxID=758847 RepID=A0A097ESY6_9LEPT|nr:hypothetical protein LSS_22910 [Leptospira santarosai serovar Shermani str. LT 821]EPG81994.1 hypothetical protein LEP1GSC048_1568 [Leptospira santarosai serovar Shermani str. 1342KT]
MKFLRIYVSLHTSFSQSSFLGILKSKLKGNCGTGLSKTLLPNGDSSTNSRNPLHRRCEIRYVRNKNLVFLINSSVSRNHSVPKERFYYRKTIDSII